MYVSNIPLLKGEVIVFKGKQITNIANSIVTTLVVLYNHKALY